MSAPAFKARLHHIDLHTGEAGAPPAGGGAQHVTLEFASAAELAPLLAAVAALPDSDTDAEPALHLQRGSTRWRLRPHRGRLVVDDPARPQGGFYERAPDEFLAELAAATAPAGPAEETADPGLALPPSRPRLMLALFAAFVAINGFALWTFLRTDGPTVPAYEWLDNAELATLGQRAAGHYATGAEPGDRVLALDTATAADWSQLDAKGVPAETERLTLRPARLDGRPVLVLVDRPEIAIELPDADTLRLHGDTYRRVK